MFLHFFHPFIHCSSSVKCAYLFQVHILISFILFHCLCWFHSVWLFCGHNLGFITAICFSVTGCWTGWPSYTPRHRVPIVVACYNLHGYNRQLVTTRGKLLQYLCANHYLVLFTTQKIMLRQHISLYAWPSIGYYTNLKISDTGVLYKKLLNRLKFHKNWCSEGILYLEV